MILSKLLCINLFQTNIPVFKTKESAVRRRYSEFEWLKKELERDSKVFMHDKIMMHCIPDLVRCIHVYDFCMNIVKSICCSLLTLAAWTEGYST